MSAGCLLVCSGCDVAGEGVVGDGVAHQRRRDYCRMAGRGPAQGVALRGPLAFQRRRAVGSTVPPDARETRSAWSVIELAVRPAAAVARAVSRRDGATATARAGGELVEESRDEGSHSQLTRDGPVVGEAQGS